MRTPDLAYMPNILAGSGIQVVYSSYGFSGGQPRRIDPWYGLLGRCGSVGGLMVVVVDRLVVCVRLFVLGLLRLLSPILEISLSRTV